MNDYLNGFKDVKFISRGSFKEVYTFTDTTTDKEKNNKRDKGVDENMLILKIAKKTTDTKNIQYLLNEILCNLFLKSNYILPTKEIHIFPDFFTVIEPLAVNGTLGMLITNLYSIGEMLKESQIWKFYIQLIDALYFIHKQGICHRDLKPDNILLDSNYIIKIHDFNTASIKRYNSLYNSTIIGTPLYMSPRVISGEYYATDIDIWSLGCILYEMIEGHSPFSDSKNWIELYKNINKISYIPLRRYDVSKEIIGWVYKLLKKNRPSALTLRKIIGSKALEHKICLQVPNTSKEFHQYTKIHCSTWNEFLHILRRLPFTKDFTVDFNKTTNLTEIGKTPSIEDINECFVVSKKNFSYRSR